MVLGINVYARHEDAIDAFEIIVVTIAASRTAPDSIAREFVLLFSKYQRHIDFDASSGKRLKRAYSGRRRRHLNHPVNMDQLTISGQVRYTGARARSAIGSSRHR